MKKIEPLKGIPADGITVAYLEGVIVGCEFVSGGKSFWITDDEDKQDSAHVYIKHLYAENAE